jgi:hypothetical protein
MKTQNAHRSVPVKKNATHEDIARLAHTLYERAGRPEGQDLEHWFNAEAMTEANFGYGKSHTEHDFGLELRGQ